VTTTVEVWRNAYQMEKLLSLSRYTIIRWGNEMAEPGQIRPMKGVSGRERPHFHPDLQAAVQLRQQKVKDAESSDRGVTLLEAADILGTSRAYARRLLKRARAPRVPVAGPKRQIVNGYCLQGVLRLEKRLPPFADTGYTKEDLVALTGWTNRTITRRLQVAGVQPMRARSPICGRVLNFYSCEEALLAVGKKVSDYPAGGDWYTVYAMGKAIGRPYQWVMRRLARRQFAASMQWRLDDCGRPKHHYPPWVFTALQIESDRDRPQLIAS
jgi:hypothetical protein